MNFKFTKERINFFVHSNQSAFNTRNLVAAVAILALSNAGLYFRNKNASSASVTAVVSQPAAASLHSAGGELILSSDELFEAGTAKLSSQSESGVARVQAFIKGIDTASIIEIEGHTDNVPVVRQKRFYPSNWELSAARAAALIPLFEQAGIAIKRLRIVGYGESRPLTSARGPASAENRRLVIRIIYQGDTPNP